MGSRRSRGGTSESLQCMLDAVVARFCYHPLFQIHHTKPTPLQWIHILLSSSLRSLHHEIACGHYGHVADCRTHIALASVSQCQQRSTQSSLYSAHSRGQSITFCGSFSSPHLNTFSWGHTAQGFVQCNGTSPVHAEYVPMIWGKYSLKNATQLIEVLRQSAPHAR